MSNLQVTIDCQTARAMLDFYFSSSRPCQHQIDALQIVMVHHIGPNDYPGCPSCLHYKEDLKRHHVGG